MDALQDVQLTERLSQFRHVESQAWQADELTRYEPEGHTL